MIGDLYLSHKSLEMSKLPPVVIYNIINITREYNRYLETNFLADTKLACDLTVDLLTSNINRGLPQSDEREESFLSDE